ncbi:MAG: hypothetical protein ACXV74_10315 [Methylobacter sp.]
MKIRKSLSMAMATGTVLLAAMTHISNVYADDVTGDFKTISTTYLNSGNENGGDVTIAGTVNHGAIQSKKSVVVEVTYDIAYTYSMTENETQTVSVPGVCTISSYYNKVAINPGTGATTYPNKSKCDNANHEHSILWIGSTTSTTNTVTHTFDETSGMTAITEPTIVKGRLNPKGKITGYNWSSIKSLVPADIALPLLPTGAILIDAAITNVTYTAYLKDVDGVQIPDTVITGDLF